MQREDRVLEGAFDTHAHGYPEFTLGMPPRVDNIEWARKEKRVFLKHSLETRLVAL